MKLTQADIESQQDPGNCLHRFDKPVPTRHTAVGWLAQEAPKLPAPKAFFTQW